MADFYSDNFFVPPKARWPHIRDEFHENIGAGLNKALGAMEEVNPALEGVLAHIDFTRVVGKPTERSERFLVIGELHHPTRSVRVSHRA